MSVQSVWTKPQTVVYEVRWRTEDGRQRSRRFDDQAEARAFDRAAVALSGLRRAQARMDSLTARERAYLEDVDRDPPAIK